MDAVILAAGSSVRFQGNKLLTRTGDRPMYRHILDIMEQLQEEGLIHRIIVVTQYEEIQKEIEERHILIRNDRPEDGISRSVRMGLQEVKEDACLFSVADQPYLTEESVRRLIRTYSSTSKGIAAAAEQKENGDISYGNPVIFSEKYYLELQELTGDVGGKRVLKQHLSDVVPCFISSAQLKDIDFREELKESSENMNQDRSQKRMEEAWPFLAEKGHKISLVGAGGKTTLMFGMADYCAAKGHHVVVGTTTHIWKPEKHILAKTPAAVYDLWNRGEVAVIGKLEPSGKLHGFPDWYEEIFEKADLVLVEADGSARRPCKVPAEHEPAIFPGSDIVIGVMGLSALGSPVEEVVFRTEQAKHLLGKEGEELLREEDMAKILSSEQGLRKNVASADYYMVLNQWEHERHLQQAQKIAGLVRKNGEGEEWTNRLYIARAADVPPSLERVF